MDRSIIFLLVRQLEAVLGRWGYIFGLQNLSNM